VQQITRLKAKMYITILRKQYSNIHFGLRKMYITILFVKSTKK